MRRPTIHPICIASTLALLLGVASEPPRPARADPPRPPPPSDARPAADDPDVCDMTSHLDMSVTRP